MFQLRRVEGARRATYPEPERTLELAGAYYHWLNQDARFTAELTALARTLLPLVKPNTQLGGQPEAVRDTLSSFSRRWSLPRDYGVHDLWESIRWTATPKRDGKPGTIPLRLRPGYRLYWNEGEAPRRGNRGTWAIHPRAHRDSEAVLDLTRRLYQAALLGWSWFEIAAASDFMNEDGLPASRLSVRESVFTLAERLGIDLPERQAGRFLPNRRPPE